MAISVMTLLLYGLKRLPARLVQFGDLMMAMIMFVLLIVYAVAAKSFFNGNGYYDGYYYYNYKGPQRLLCPKSTYVHSWWLHLAIVRNFSCTTLIFRLFEQNDQNPPYTSVFLINPCFITASPSWPPCLLDSVPLPEKDTQLYQPITTTNPHNMVTVHTTVLTTVPVVTYHPVEQQRALLMDHQRDPPPNGPLPPHPYNSNTEHESTALQNPFADEAGKDVYQGGIPPPPMPLNPQPYNNQYR